MNEYRVVLICFVGCALEPPRGSAGRTFNGTVNWLSEACYHIKHSETDDRDWRAGHTLYLTVLFFCDVAFHRLLMLPEKEQLHVCYAPAKSEHLEFSCNGVSGCNCRIES